MYYIAAQKILAGKTIGDVYVTDMAGLDILPEGYPLDCYFIYSPTIAYLISPLAVLSYYDAKVTFMMLNAFFYYISIILLLRRMNLFNLINITISSLFMFMPFFISYILGQVNSIILLLITLSILAYCKDKVNICGTLLGLAANFKIFPLLLSFILAKANRSIPLIAVLFFSVSLLMPGTNHWLNAITTVSAGHTPVFIYLESIDVRIFPIYSVAILVISYAYLLVSRTKDFFLLIGYSLPSAFLAMPVVQYHHLMILSITYTVLILSDRIKLCIFTLSLLILTILHINLYIIIEDTPNYYWSVLILWATTTILLLKNNKTTSLPSESFSEIIHLQ